jgi:large subunit ribosomal protein L13
MATYSTKASEIQRNWYLVDADGQVMGRLASEVASLIMGKWKPITCPHLDVGDHVIITNAAKVRITGRKLERKTFFTHTGYLGSGRKTLLRDRMATDPAEVLRDAVWGMIPHTRLGRQMIRKLKVYAGVEHPHAAQEPIPIQMGLHGRGYPGQESAS